MRYDAFSKRHPVVNFLFFAGALGMSMLIQHPVYLMVGGMAGALYYLLLNGRKGWRMLLGVFPLFVFVTVINPLLNTQGAYVLFHLFGKPYTFEALLYGAAVGAVFVVMLLWLGCYNKVLTGDKFVSLFGNCIPVISLLLVMVFRMIPNLRRKAAQFLGARKAIGKGADENASFKEKLMDGMTVLGALTSWALEGSVTTADSMRSRGYGTTMRTSFMRYRWTVVDIVLMVIIFFLWVLIIIAICKGQTAAAFTPQIVISPVSWGIIPYAIYLLIPTILHIKESVQWHISRSKI